MSVVRTICPIRVDLYRDFSLLLLATEDRDSEVTTLDYEDYLMNSSNENDPESFFLVLQELGLEIVKLPTYADLLISKSDTILVMTARVVDPNSKQIQFPNSDLNECSYLTAFKYGDTMPEKALIISDNRNKAKGVHEFVVKKLQELECSKDVLHLLKEKYGVQELNKQDLQLAA